MANQRDVSNYYEILEVAPGAPPTEIHKAYLRAKNTYSQDNPALYSMFSKEEAQELLRLIEEAYTVLSSPSERRAYDDHLMRGMNQSAPGAASSTSAATVESAHRALPDFGAPDASGSGGQAYHQGQASAGNKGHESNKATKATLPPGMGKTMVSTYKIDEAFEAEIAETTEFDGSFLQKVRLYKNISVDRMSEATRIGRHYLMALETNDYKSLPAPVFVRGFVVQVARLLGLDDNKVANSYMKLFKAGGGK